MITRHIAQATNRTVAFALLAMTPLVACAQAPVDDSGNVIGSYEPALVAPDASLAVGNEDIPLMSDVDLEVLVGPIALYPDDLLAIVLPASAYPLQIIDAARFLEELELDPSLKPNPEWDDSVVALLNYPEVIELLNDDIDWTWRLGEAVVSQQGDVVSAIEVFRDRAYAAGNLKSDSYQNVTRDEGIIAIEPIADDVIYVPYYEPERVVVYQPRPVYYYYPRSYPVYYYPYSSSYAFDRGYFWGVTTAFSIGWMTDSLNVYHHSYRGHPYYGHSYWDRWWYRRPTMNSYNTTYVRNTNVTINRYYNGDRWSPRHDRREYVNDTRLSDRRRSETRVTRNRDYERNSRRDQTAQTRTVRRQEPIEFRDRQAQPDRTRTDRVQTGQARTARAQSSRQRTSRTEAGSSSPERQQAALRQSTQRSETTRRAPREQVTPQRQTRQEPRERATPQRQTRQAPRERATPQRSTPPQRATPQREARQAPRERAAPQRQSRPEPRESRSESSRKENRRSESSGRKERKSRR